MAEAQAGLDANVIGFTERVFTASAVLLIPAALYRGPISGRNRYRRSPRHSPGVTPAARQKVRLPAARQRKTRSSFMSKWRQNAGRETPDFSTTSPLVDQSKPRSRKRFIARRDRLRLMSGCRASLTPTKKNFR
jgi:hypothetical protein